MFVVFVATLARPAAVEADVLAASLGSSAYELRLALAAGPPSVVLRTTNRDRAADVLAALRSRGHAAHIFDEETFVASPEMTRLDDFTIEPDGLRRTATSAEFLPFGDVYAILRAMHETSSSIETAEVNAEGFMPNTLSHRIMVSGEDREHVAYFFRRSGDKPWLLRERHASYAGLGAERGPTAFVNFTRLLTLVRAQSAMAIFDDRLVRRRVAERAGAEGQRSSRDGMDILAHLLAMTIASQGGSPYR